MARVARLKSNSGIYHVMIRGINKQLILEDDEDNQKFLEENCVQIESWGPFAEWRNNMFTNDLLVSLAKKYNKSVAQIILRWLNQRNVIIIPKSVKKERMQEMIWTPKSRM